MEKTLEISANDKIVLSKEKIKLQYTTYQSFCDAFNISRRRFEAMTRKPGVRWATINKGREVPIPIKYIDWEKTSFIIVDEEVKAARVTLDERGL